MRLFLSTFATVFLLSFQQQNVIQHAYLPAILTAYIIAAAQFVMFKAVANGKTIEILYMGTGGALGVAGSMWVHGWMV